MGNLRVTYRVYKVWPSVHLDCEEDGQYGLQDARHDAGVVEVLRDELACVG